MTIGNGKTTTSEELQAIVSAYEKLSDDDPAKATLRSMFERMGFKPQTFNAVEALRLWLEADTRDTADVNTHLDLYESITERFKLLCHATIVMWHVRNQMTESKWATLLQYAHDGESCFGKETTPVEQLPLPAVEGLSEGFTKAMGEPTEPTEEESLITDIYKLTGWPVDCQLIPELHTAIVTYTYLPFRRTEWEKRTVTQERGQLNELRKLALRRALQYARLDHDRERSIAMLAAKP